MDYFLTYGGVWIFIFVVYIMAFWGMEDTIKWSKEHWKLVGIKHLAAGLFSWILYGFLH